MRAKRNHVLAIQPLASGLKCDKPGCGFVVKGIPLDKHTIPSLVGLPCPLCGNSLLTKEDADKFFHLIKVISFINVVMFPYMLFKQIGFLLGLFKRSKTNITSVSSDRNGNTELTDRRGADSVK